MNALFDIIPQTCFVEDLKQNILGTIKIAVLRETIGNAIIRSNYPDETITFKLSPTKDVVEVPARKLKSREKLLGLRTCRRFGVVDPVLRYNVIKKREQLANPNSILFGDSITESNDTVALRSRVIYDWAYSLRDIDEITATMQHNALSEGGTMWDEEKGDHRQSLFQVQYVKPGVFLPHFIMVENVTPELFIHLLACIMYESRYFAQSTTNSSANVKNHILGIGYSSFEQPVNSYTIAKNWDENTPVDFETVSSTMNDTMKAAYGEEGYIPGKVLTDFMEGLWQDEKALQTIYQKAKEDCARFLKDINVTK
ncbi:MAG: type I-D CRISPR-associated protein Cas7/Csc2 [Cytophagales bacterium]|nr:type I-D CRISPR-associated protein Cas7/Csc2 [Cytophagales bacterium]